PTNAIAFGVLIRVWACLGSKNSGGEFIPTTRRDPASHPESIREKVDVEVDYRLVDPGGAVRYVHSTGHPVLSPSGDLIELFGTVIDITERKRAEEELRASERKYRDVAQNFAELATSCHCYTAHLLYFQWFTIGTMIAKHTGRVRSQESADAKN